MTDGKYMNVQLVRNQANNLGPSGRPDVSTTCSCAQLTLWFLLPSQCWARELPASVATTAATGKTLNGKKRLSQHEVSEEVRDAKYRKEQT